MSDQERQEVTDAIHRAHAAAAEAVAARVELERLAADRHRRKRQRDHLAASVYMVFASGKDGHRAGS